MPFVTDRCEPWLQFQQNVRVEGAAREVAPEVHALRGRLRPPSAFQAKFAGVVALFAASIAFMADARPAQVREDVARGATIARAAGVSLGGLGVGAFAFGRRLDRTAPALAVLVAARGATLTDRELRALTTGARKDLSENSWPDGQVWVVSEAPLAPASRAAATELGVRCFAVTPAGIAEV